MPTDRYGLDLSTTSAAARDAYVAATELALTLYPGAVAAYDRAIENDPGFALAHAGKAQVLMRGGDVAAARAALTAAKEAVARAALRAAKEAASREPGAGLSERKASHTALFDLAYAGRINAAIDAVQ